MKYEHHVSYIAENNIIGCVVVKNLTQKYELSYQVNKLSEEIKSLNGFKGLIVTNIITFEVFDL